MSLSSLHSTKANLIEQTIETNYGVHTYRAWKLKIHKSRKYEESAKYVYMYVGRIRLARHLCSHSRQSLEESASVHASADELYHLMEFFFTYISRTN